MLQDAWKRRSAIECFTTLLNNLKSQDPKFSTLGHAIIPDANCERRTRRLPLTQTSKSGRISSFLITSPERHKIGKEGVEVEGSAMQSAAPREPGHGQSANHEKEMESGSMGQYDSNHFKVG